MAILKSIELCNFAQHEHIRMELGAGITTLVGPNGSGKTNAMLAALATLSNDFKLFPGKKPSLIRRHSNGRSSVATTWALDDGGTLEVCRVLRGGQSYVVVNGKKLEDIRREPEITEQCEQLIGFSRDKVISQHAVLQSQVDAIVMQAPTDKVRSMASLLDCQFLLPDATQFSRELSYVNGRLDNSDARSSQDVQAELWEVVRQYADCLRRTFASRRVCPSLDDVQLARKVIDNVSKREELTKERQTCTGHIPVLRERKEEITKAISQCRDTLREIESHRAKAVEWAEVEKTKKSLQDESTRNANALNLLRRLKKQADEALADEPKEPEEDRPDAEEIEKLEWYIADRKHSLKRTEVGEDTCPTCGQDIEPMAEDEVATLRQELQTSQEKLQQYLRVQDDWKSYDRELERFEAAKPGHLEDLNQTETSLKQEAERAVSVEKQLEALPKEKPRLLLIDVEAKVKANQDWIDEANRRLGTTEAQLETKEERLEEIRKLLADLEAKNATSVTEAEKTLERLESCREELAQCKYERQGYLKARRTLLEERKKATQREREEANLRKWSVCVENVAQDIRPVNMPKEILSAVMSVLTRPMSLVCQHMQLPFRIECDDALELQAHHYDGSVESAKCLSGGQRACVSIAFWLAKLLRLNSGVRVLMIDEPAANLDSEVVIHLAELLRSVSETAKKAGVQIVLSTHHRQLEVCADYGYSFYGK